MNSHESGSPWNFHNSSFPSFSASDSVIVYIPVAHRSSRGMEFTLAMSLSTVFSCTSCHVPLQLMYLLPEKYCRTDENVNDPSCLNEIVYTWPCDSLYPSLLRSRIDDEVIRHVPTTSAGVTFLVMCRSSPKQPVSMLKSKVMRSDGKCRMIITM